MSFGRHILNLPRPLLERVLVPEGKERFEKLLAEVDGGFRASSVQGMNRLGVELEGASVLPAAFVDQSALLAFDNRELSFLGVPVLHFYVRSWLLQTLTGYTQQEIKTLCDVLLASGNTAAVYRALPISTTYLASPEMRAIVATPPEQIAAEQRKEVDAFFSRLLYATIGALYLEIGLPSTLDFVETHVAPGLVQVSV
ncbi:hypothetical protein DIPPA_07296 [Diplonema papillatum]|nr:hypothetical protein DIPPA_07296 [Diplonema papillatum]